MLVLVGGEKGGVGKTTLTLNLAAMRARAGKDVLLVDGDKQASANLWAGIRREAKVEPTVACVQKTGKTLGAEVNELAGESTAKRAGWLKPRPHSTSPPCARAPGKTCCS